MDFFENIEVGMRHERVVTIEEKHTTLRTTEPILSTPQMIALMEGVSADMVQPLLPPNFTTVGYEVHVKHKAPAKQGSKINVWAKLREANGRKLLFEVRVSEESKIIGEGTHRRTIIPITKA